MIVWFSKHQRGRFDAYEYDDEDWDWLEKKKRRGRCRDWISTVTASNRCSKRKKKKEKRSKKKGEKKSKKEKKKVTPWKMRSVECNLVVDRRPPAGVGSRDWVAPLKGPSSTRWGCSSQCTPMWLCSVRRIHDDEPGGAVCLQMCFPCKVGRYAVGRWEPRCGNLNQFKNWPLKCSYSREISLD